ncbi:hypothetical protein QZH41_002374 [Actinostola sp. cb2023]|nr:hypothetical protein QZH41_002374 [Actinostola sp. cb2023]
MSATLLQHKMSFLIDDLILRDAHDRNKMPADTPAVVTTGFPRYCFAPVTLVSHISCYDDVTESGNERDPLPCSPDYLGDVSRSDSDAESCRAERKQLSADLNMTDEQVKTWFKNKRTKLKKKMSRVDAHYAKLLYLNEIATGYHSYPKEYPVLRRTVGGRLSYL